MSAIDVTHGLFTIGLEDFGANALNGDARWLAIAVRCPTRSGGFTALNPRPPLTPAPMALALPGLYTRPNTESPNLIGGYSGNVISPTVVGGTINGGGLLNGENRVWDNYGTIGRGNINIVSGNAATIGGGSGNFASGLVATVGGGQGNNASGNHATIPGGGFNTATGDYSFAAGRGAHANHPGTFVWSCATCTGSSTAPDQFIIKANGGVGINTNAPTRTLEVNGMIGIYDNARILYGGLATEVYGQLVELGINDSAANRFGGAYDSTAPGGFFRVDARGGAANLFEFWGRPAGNTLPVALLASLDISGVLTVNGLGSAGSTSLCYNASNQIAACSSSLRYKNNIANLNLGLDTVTQLRPVTFNWKTNGESDLGLVAEEVNQVSPLLTTLNKDGQIEGVKYDRIAVVLVKAMQEQQQQIADLKTQNATQQQEIAQLKRGAAPDQSFNLFNLISVLALGGVIVVGLRQKRGGLS